MNKLTEIKAKVESFYTDPDVRNTLGTVEEMEYLISLLEEKDKALKRIIDYYNDTSTNDITACKAMKREAVNAIELNDALNTSSNNEGD
jgi:hypothetical protein